MAQSSDSESTLTLSPLSLSMDLSSVSDEPEIPMTPMRVNVKDDKVAGVLSREGYFLPEEKTLSSTHRGTTTVLRDFDGKRFVCRVSKYEEPEKRSDKSLRNHLRKSCDRILRFGEYWHLRQQEVYGLVPMLAKPEIVDDEWLVEKYEEILVVSEEETRRMDLHKFCTTELPSCFDTDKRSELGIAFLYDVVHTVADLHDHQWVHLDISLENIAISRTQGFLIDFESSLRFNKESNGYIQKGHIKVPLKLPFVPPENFSASKTDLVCLPTYDVWSLSCMLFALLFRRYPFSFSSRESGQNPNQREIRYFCRHGFEKFVRKYHRVVYNQFNTSKEPWMPSARDLLGKLFVGFSKSRNRRTKVVRFNIKERLTAREMFNHPFWQIYGCPRHE